MKSELVYHEASQDGLAFYTVERRELATCAACNTVRLARDLAPRDDDEGSVCVDGCGGGN